MAQFLPLPLRVRVWLRVVGIAWGCRVVGIARPVVLAHGSSTPIKKFARRTYKRATGNSAPAAFSGITKQQQKGKL